MLQGISTYGWLCGLLLCAAPAIAQTTPDTTIAAALRNLGDRSASVFSGEVTAIRHAGGVVEIEFNVDQSLKGQATGTVILREWAGLWAAGQRRYWVGERAVVFLHEAGKSGLSSSVDGMEGVLPISPDAAALLGVDVQRLRTRVLRNAGAPMIEADAQISLAQVALAVLPPSIGEPTLPPVIAPIKRPMPPPIHRPIEGPIRGPIRPLPVRNRPVMMMLEDSSVLEMTDETDTREPAKKTDTNPEFNNAIR